MSGLPWAWSHRCAALAPITMALITSMAAGFGSPQEDPFLLLESTLKAVERLLRHADQRPLQRCWIDHPYGEEELTRLEEEVMPVLASFIARIDEIDQALEAEQEALIETIQASSPLC